ncbi:hypothetical protein PAXRUDRAFT_170821, partial [Paxillus rubicundulus Ve08.2h10]
FIPERFIDGSGGLTSDTVDFVWGFGRRACSGRHLGEASVWAGMSSMLATFTFLPAQTPDGEDVAFKPKWFEGLPSHPLPFPFRMIPRVQGMNAETLTQLIQSSTVDEN